MRLFPAMILIGILLLPAVSYAEQSAVLLIVDGMGASYVSEGLEASYVDGEPIPHIDMTSLPDAAYTLRVAEPKTEIGHAVIVTGYSKADSETVSYYDATIFDAVRKHGYLTIAIMEKGDSGYVVDEQDIIVHDKKNSVYDPCIVVETNGHETPYELAMWMNDYPSLSTQKRGKDPYAAYVIYDTWALDFAAFVVSYMHERFPDTRYLLTVNVGGVDSAGHSLGSDGYEATIKGVDGNLSSLIKACDKSGILLLVTGDHGMSFTDEASRGSHSNEAAASRNESLLVPVFMIGANVTQDRCGVYGQERLAPSLLALMGCRNTLSMSDGTTLPGIVSPYMDDAPPSERSEGGGSATGYVAAGAVGVTGIALSLVMLRKRR